MRYLRGAKGEVSPFLYPTTWRTKAENEHGRRFPASEVTLDCGHGNAVCQACILRFVADSLKSQGRWDRVSCIECKVPMTKAGLSKLLPVKEIARYEQHKFIRAERCRLTR